MNQDQKEARKGMFTASRMSDLLAEGSGQSRNNYIFDVAAGVFGCDSRVETAEMRHGIINQHNAFRLAVQPMFPDAVWFDDFIPINDNCGASPDVVIDGIIPLDVKCPTSVDSFSSEVAKYRKVNTADTNAAYFVQCQTQMLATNADQGHLLFYLTKFESYMDTDWREYAVPLEDRTEIITFERNVKVQDAILSAVTEAAIRRDRIIERMANATIMDDAEYFYTQTRHNCLVPAKRAANPLSIDYIRVGNKFYYKK